MFALIVIMLEKLLKSEKKVLLLIIPVCVRWVVGCLHQDVEVRGLGFFYNKMWGNLLRQGLLKQINIVSICSPMVILGQNCVIYVGDLRLLL